MSILKPCLNYLKVGIFISALADKAGNILRIWSIGANNTHRWRQTCKTESILKLIIILEFFKIGKLKEFSLFRLA